ncbi:MAG: response regulator [Candidatus Omnitrophica bacterium]|nr:response regulator [Candidatus Omnitrophota bacterium]
MSIRKILVVDDSQTQKNIYREILTGAGYKVDIANNGVEGLEAARTIQPDVIITDISMPLMDGIEMVKILKKDERTKYIPIICASATFQDIGTKMKALLDAGAEEYFYMPQDRLELLAKVSVMLRIRTIYNDLLEKNRQLKQFNDASVGRELKMIELKDKITELEKKLASRK